MTRTNASSAILDRVKSVSDIGKGGDSFIGNKAKVLMLEGGGGPDPISYNWSQG